ncbi:Tigger transposable element-derived protein 6, partial [Dictyocoela muelleri]
FIKREKLSFVKLHGESASADTNKIDNFKVTLGFKMEYYLEKDIFNIDETGLYVKEGGDISFVYDKKKDNKNIKRNKTRITLMLGCNKLREWLISLLIGKSKKPRVFKNVNLEDYNVLYNANQTSWLVKDLFNEYLTILNDSLKKQNRRILVLCDNFYRHMVENKSNIELFFFPPNCTSIIQPLDMGIIFSSKTKFKKC